MTASLFASAGQMAADSIDLINTGITTAATSSGYNVVDGNEATGWELVQGATNGWLEIQIKEMTRIEGIEMFGSSLPGQRLSIDVWQRTGWVSYPGYPDGLTSAGGSYFDFTADILVTDRLRIRVEGEDLDGFGLTELRAFGYPVAGMGSRAKVKKIAASDNTDMFNFADALADGNPGTEWKLLDYNAMTEAESKAHHILKSKSFASRLFPAPAYKEGQVVFELDEESEIDCVNILTSSSLNGDIRILVLEGSVWTDVGSLPRTAAPGWHRLSIDPAHAVTGSVKIDIVGSVWSVRGIAEVEIWKKGIATDFMNICDGGILSGSDKLSFVFDAMKTDRSGIEMDFAHDAGPWIDMELNGIVKRSAEKLSINGIVRYGFAVPKHELKDTGNVASILPAGSAARMLGARLTGKFLSLVEYRSDTPFETNLDLGTFEYVNDVFIETGRDATVLIDRGSGYCVVPEVPVSDVIRKYPVGTPAVGLCVVNPSGGGMGAILIESGISNSPVSDIEFLSPNTTPSIPSWMAEADNYLFICRLAEEPVSVSFNGTPCNVRGLIFWIPFSELGLTAGGYTPLSFTVARADGSTHTVEIEVLVEWQFVEFSVNPPDERIYTNQSSIVFTGRYSSVSNRLEIECQGQPVTGITILGSGRDFECAVNLQDGLNRIVFTLFSSDGRKYRTEEKTVVRHNQNISLVVDTPLDCEYLNTRTVTVEGKIDRVIGLEVKVNGALAALSGLSYKSDPVVLEEGLNRIVVQAVLSGDVVAEKTINVNADRTAPVITVEGPPAGSIFNRKTVTVRAGVSDASRIAVSVNNMPAVKADDMYECALVLEDGIRALRIVAVDAAGNRSESVVGSVTIDTAPPEYFTVYVNPDTWTNLPAVGITCVTTDALTGVSEYEMSVDGEGFVPLSNVVGLAGDGEHSIVVKATDGAGNVRQAEGKAYIDRTPPAEPSGFRAIPGNGRIVLEWEKSDTDVSRYMLMRLPGFSGSIPVLELAQTDSISNRYIDRDGINGETAYMYTLIAVDRAGNPSMPAVSDAIIEGIQIIDVSGQDPDDPEPVLVEYDESALVMKKTAFPGGVNVRQIVCAELEKTIGVDENGDGIVDEYKDAPIVERASNPIVGPVYNYSVLVEENGDARHVQHVVFDEPFLGRIRYDEGQIPSWATEENLDVYYFNDIWCTWIKIEDSFVDAENDQVVFSTNHFSSFSVQPTIMDDIKPEDLKESGYSPLSTYVDHGGVTVSPEGGGAHTEVTEFSLPGKNGFDFALKRTYDTSLALGDSSGLSIAASVGVNFINAGSGLKDTGEIINEVTDLERIGSTLLQSGLSDLAARFEKILKSQGDYAYSMGQGWRLNLPYIRSSNGGVLIRLPDGAFYDITEMTPVAKSDQFIYRELVLENHDGEDFTLKVSQARLDSEMSDLLNLILHCQDPWNAFQALVTTMGNETKIEEYLERLCQASNFEVTDMESAIAKGKLDLLESQALLAQKLNPYRVGASITNLVQSVANQIPDWNLMKAELVMKDGTTYRFNQKGMLDSIIDPTGKYDISLTYDDNGGMTTAGWRLIGIRDSMGRTIAFEYEERNVFLGVKKPFVKAMYIENDPYGRRVDYTMDTAGLLSSVDNATFRKFLDYTVQNNPLFPVSLLSKTVNSANKTKGGPEKLRRIYHYDYDARYLVEFGGAAKLNILSALGDAVCMSLCGVPAVSMISGWDNLTLSADVRFSIVFPLKEMNGPGIGRITLGNQIKNIDYALLECTDKLLGFLPVSIEGKMRHVSKLVVERLDKYKVSQQPLPDSSTLYSYGFAVSPHENIYNKKATVDDGRLVIEYTYGYREEESSRMISWSDHVVENLQNVLLIAPYFRMKTMNTGETRYSKTGGNLKLIETVTITPTSDYSRIKTRKVERAGGIHYTTTTYDYDKWGNAIFTSESVHSGDRTNNVEEYGYYFEPGKTSQGWGSLEAYGTIPSAFTNKYQSEHDLLALKRIETDENGLAEEKPFERHDLLLGRVRRNYLSADDIPQSCKPAGIEFPGYADEKTCYNYDGLGRSVNESTWSDTDSRWIEKDFGYDPDHGYMNTIVADFKASGQNTETHETAIVHDYTDDEYFTITATALVTTPDGNDAQTVTTRTGYEKTTGWKAWESDGRGYCTTYEYDGLGRVVFSEKPSDTDARDYNPVVSGLDRNNGNPETRIAYADMSPAENPEYYSEFTSIVTKDADNGRTTESKYTYDNLGRLTAVSNRNTNYDYTNDPAGNGMKTVVPLGSCVWIDTTLEYNGYGEIKKITRPFDGAENRSTEYEYDAMGRVDKITDTDYQWTVNRGSVNNRYVLLDYDYASNELVYSDERGNAAHEFYDMKGRVIKKSRLTQVYASPFDKGFRTIESRTYYDGAGNPIIEIDGGDRITVNQYDNLNRLVRIVMPGSGGEKAIIDKNTGVYDELLNVLPTVEYAYTLNGMKTAEKFGFIGAAESEKRKAEFRVDELGRVYVSGIGYTSAISGTIANVSDVRTEDWTAYDWSGIGWTESGAAVRADRITYFDENGNKTREIDAMNAELVNAGSPYYCNEYEYNARNKVSVEKTGVKRHGNLTLDAGSVTVYHYDLLDNLSNMTDPREFTAYYSYDDLNRLILAVNPRNIAETANPYVWFEYYPNNKVKLREDGPDGNVTAYTYNTKGGVLTEGLKSSRGASGNTYATTFGYDAHGNVAEVVDNLGYVTEKYFDELNREYMTVLPDSSIVQTGYDANGNKSYVARGSNGERQSWTYYDNYNRPVKTVDALNNKTETWYDVSGNKRKTQDAKNRLSFCDYDEAGRLIREENIRHTVRTYGYDANGNMVLSLDPDGNKSLYFYDRKNMLTGSVVRRNDTIQWISREYDRAGGIMSATTSENVTVRYNYVDGAYVPDPFGRIMSRETDINGERNFVTGYSYDGAGNVTGIEYVDGANVGYGYNRFGQLVTMNGYIASEPRYDENGLLETLTAVNGVVNTLSYDKLGRVECTDYSKDEVSIKKYTLSYNRFGNIAMINGGQYDYDAIDRLVNARVIGNFEIDVEKKNETQRAGMVEEDVLGEKELSFSGEESDVVTLDYGAVSIGVNLGESRDIGRIRLYPSGDLSVSGNLDKRNFAVFVAERNGEGNYSFVPESSWILEKLDRGILEIRFRTPVRATYVKVHCFCDERDADNVFDTSGSLFSNTRMRIMSVYYISHARNEAYGYDSAGNRTFARIALDGEEAEETTYAYYNDSDLLLWDGAFAYDWDSNGNMTAKGTEPLRNGAEIKLVEGHPDFSETTGIYWRYEYDLFNRLVRVEKSAAGKAGLVKIAEYLYGEDHLRVKKTRFTGGSADEVKYYSFGNNGELLFEESDTRYGRYVYAGDSVFAKETGSRIAMNGTVSYVRSATYYYCTNHSGNTTMITDETGSVVWQDELSPFGESGGTIGIIDEDALYTGKQMDEDTGLYYFNARWYDPGAGRFISEDPVKDGANWYIYCGNDPVGLIDEYGLDDAASEKTKIKIGLSGQRDIMLSSSALDYRYNATFGYYDTNYRDITKPPKQYEKKGMPDWDLRNYADEVVLKFKNPVLSKGGLYAAMNYVGVGYEDNSAAIPNSFVSDFSTARGMDRGPDGTQDSFKGVRMEPGYANTKIYNNCPSSEGNKWVDSPKGYGGYFLKEIEIANYNAQIKTSGSGKVGTVNDGIALAAQSFGAASIAYSAYLDVEIHLAVSGETRIWWVTAPMPKIDYAGGGGITYSRRVLTAAEALSLFGIKILQQEVKYRRNCAVLKSETSNMAEKLAAMQSLILGDEEK